jgi:hypothetical protein
MGTHEVPEAKREWVQVCPAKRACWQNGFKAKDISGGMLSRTIIAAGGKE